MTSASAKSKPEAGLVSVVMPTFNAERFIRESVASVLEQDHHRLELLAVDDHSSDETVAILNEIRREDDRLKILENAENLGAAASRNRALAAASGQFVAFLDADDVWLEGKLSRQLQFMREQQAAFSFTAYQVCDESGEPTGKKVDIGCPDRLNYADMLAKKATLGCSTVLYDQTIVGRREMPPIRTGQDYGLWLAILKDGFVAVRLAEVLTSYRVVPGSISRNKFRKAARQWEIYREIEGLPVWLSTWYFCNYAYRAVRRV